MLATWEREPTWRFLVLFFQEWIRFNRESMCSMNLWKIRYWMGIRESQGLHYPWDQKCSIEVSQKRGLWGYKKHPLVKNSKWPEILPFYKLVSLFSTVSWMLAKDTRFLDQKPRVLLLTLITIPRKSVFSCTSFKPQFPQGIAKGVRWQLYEQWVASQKRNSEFREV